MFTKINHPTNNNLINLINTHHNILQLYFKPLFTNFKNFIILIHFLFQSFLQTSTKLINHQSTIFTRNLLNKNLHYQIIIFNQKPKLLFKINKNLIQIFTFIKNKNPTIFFNHKKKQNIQKNNFHKTIITFINFNLKNNQQLQQILQIIN